MNYLLAFHIVLAIFVLTQFLVRGVALVIQGTKPAKGRFKSLAGATGLTYVGVLLASADKLTFGNVGWSALALTTAWTAAEISLKIFAGLGQRQQASTNA